MSHTPGPWNVVTEFASADDEGIDIQFVAAIEPIIYSCDMAGNSEQQFSNARLIAAAPELLEACEYTLSVLILNHLENGAAGDMLRNSIAKAKGGEK